MFLERVVVLTAKRVRKSKMELPAPQLERLCANCKTPPSFREAISKKKGEDIKIIAEVKRESPSRGPIRPDLVVEDLVRDYSDGGASALSVLTEPVYFGGIMADVTQARLVSGLPILRKDFIIDPYQLLETKAAGASAVLFIAAILDRARLRSLLEEADRLELEALVEVHDRKELATVLELDARVIGINNRNLSTLEVDLEITRRLAPLVPDSKVLVSESGYSQREQIRETEAYGVDAVLVGEALVRDENPRLSLARLRGDDGANA
jgi:indole-3-glycerol phosphate synthase